MIRVVRIESDNLFKLDIYYLGDLAIAKLEFKMKNTCFPAS